MSFTIAFDEPQGRRLGGGKDLCSTFELDVLERFKRTSCSGAHSIDLSGIGLSWVLRNSSDPNPFANRRLPERLRLVELDPPLRLLLVDDHEIVRAGLRALLERVDGLRVVGEAALAVEAVRRTGLDDPHVVVMDTDLPDGSGVEACREIRSLFPHVKVLILTAVASEEALLAAILAGASGYVLKQGRLEDLVTSIRNVGKGESLLDPQMTDTLFSRLRQGPKEDTMLDRLTEQEQQIVHLIGEGCTNRQIGERLFLAEKTVKNYVSTLLGKLGMNRRSEAAAFSARMEFEKKHPYDREDW